MAEQSARSIEKAVTLHRRGRLDEAEQIYAAVLAADPQHFDALHLSGVLSHQLGRSAEALRLVAAALKARPGSIDAMANYGVILDALERHEEALAQFDKVLAAQPGDARTFANRGKTLRDLGRHTEALASYDRAIAIARDDADAFYNRSLVLMDLRRFEEALDSCEHALALRPNYIDALHIRGNALVALQRLEEARAAYMAILALRPDHADTFNNLGGTFAEMGRYDEALATYERGAAIEPDNARIHYNAALALLTCGDFCAGWSRYEWRWKLPNWRARRRNFAQPQWRGDMPVGGKTILLHAEQGLGDTLQFIRYAPLVAALGAEVIAEVQPPLKTLLASMESVKVISSGETLPWFDLHCPLLSLPLAFGTEPSTIPAAIPYVGIPSGRLTKWRQRLGERRSMRVGVVWAGNPLHDRDRSRSIPLAHFAKLFSAAGVEFVSLQRDLTLAQSAVLSRHANVMDVGRELDDFADSAALMSLLDVIVSVDTATAHLAGAVGKPVWVLLQFSPDYRWMLGRNDSPWYPTARLFRQSSIGDWDGPLSAVQRELRAVAELGVAAQ